MGQSSLGGGSLNRDSSRSLSAVIRLSMVDAPIRPENAEGKEGRKWKVVV